MVTDRLKAATALMERFAARTGLSSDRTPTRYLWTDAFAVCNFLGLARQTAEPRFTELAVRLVEQVHEILGHHRSDASRQGWLSGLGQAEGRAHPTLGGLRIGKSLPERRPGEPHDDRLEWERDGQYFHYLTRWMSALDLATHATGDPRFNLWARELAALAHDAFVYRSRGNELRMYWKMSIDLTRPLVASMGHHDPLDGYVTYAGLIATARRFEATEGPSLATELSSFAQMIEGIDFAASDPLGLGGLLMDAERVAALRAQGALAATDLLARLLGSAARGLAVFESKSETEEPARYRLAFRELGLAIGLEALAAIDARLANAPQMAAVKRYLPLAERIREFWLENEHQRVPSWRDHLDINEVMLATALAPEGCLTTKT